MEKLLRKNDRKLKRLLNTVSDKNSDKKSLVNIDDNTIADFLGDENRKFATTELLNILNVAHNDNISLKRKLEKSLDELQTTRSIIDHLEAEKKEIQSNHQLQSQYEYDNGPIIEQLEQQLSEYKVEIVECHQIFDKLTKSNDDSLHKLAERDGILCEMKNTVRNEKLFNDKILDEIAVYKSKNKELKKELNESRDIVQNEKLFNDKILDEIAVYKSKNKEFKHKLQEQNEIESQSQLQIKKLSNKLQKKNEIESQSQVQVKKLSNKLSDIEHKLQKHHEIESQSQVQVKRLSNKLFDIEFELKERIESYQIFEKYSIKTSKFVNELVAKSENQNDDEIKSLCNNIKICFEDIQNPDNDFNEIANNAMEFVQEKEATISPSKSHTKKKTYTFITIKWRYPCTLSFYFNISFFIITH